jgi:uncharacterized phage protein gp47/JayE
MSFPVPSFADLDAQIASDLASIPGADPTIKFGVLPVLQKILAKLAAAELAYLAALPARVLIPTTAEGEYLDRWANAVGLSRLTASVSAGSVIFTGSNEIAIPSGTQLQDSTGQIILATTQIGTIVNGTATVPVVSITAGSITNLATGAPVTLLTAIAGVLAVATVATPGMTGGTDAETDAALQVRLVYRLSNPPQGGALADFVDWAKLTPGVTRVWVYPDQTGPGTVSITFTMDARIDPIPLSADVATVQSVINANAPVIGQYTVFACTPLTQSVTISNLAAAPGFTLASAQAAITSAIAALNYQTVPGGTFYIEQVQAAIANAPGVATFDLTAPTADITASFGELIQFAAPVFV